MRVYFFELIFILKIRLYYAGVNILGVVMNLCDPRQNKKKRKRNGQERKKENE